jgi:hypothetical protein
MNQLQKFENALGELSLILDSDANESTFQKWFETNLIVFQCLGYTRVIPHPNLDVEDKTAGLFIPDFMAMNSDGLWEIVEIKTAKELITKNIGRRPTLRSPTESYISQCKEYSTRFMDREYLKRFNERYLADCHSSPNVTLIMGRSDGLDKKTVASILSARTPHITIRTYDDVREAVHHSLKVMGELPKAMSKGLCILFAAILHPSDTQQKTYIVDICKSNSNSRIQLYTFENKIHLAISDQANEKYHHTTTVSELNKILNKQVNFAIQVSNENGYSRIDLIIDEEMKLSARQHAFSFDFSNELDYVLGSDQSGSEPSNMHLAGWIVLQAIPSLEDRWVLKNFINAFKNVNGEILFREFIGNKFLHTPNHPMHGGKGTYSMDLIQLDDAKNPMLRSIKAS